MLNSAIAKIARTAVLFGAVLGLGATELLAGQCPVGKASSNGQKPGPTTHSGVRDSVIGSIDLAHEAPALKDHKFRLRRLVVQPGGVVAWHSHAERPAIIYIVSGAITEFSSKCSVPIVHRAGDVSIEAHGTEHWWKNMTRQPAVLLSTDILREGQDPKTM